MFGLTQLLVLAAAASAAVLPRDVSAVLASLATIDADNVKLNQTITSWDGTLIGALPLQSAENQLDSDVKAATTTAGSQAVFSSADSQSVINYLNSTLAPDANAALQNIISRKAAVTSAGISGPLHDGIVTLKTDIDALGQALLKIASADTQSAAQAQLATLDASLQAAIDAFASSS